MGSFTVRGARSYVYTHRFYFQGLFNALVGHLGQMSERRGRQLLVFCGKKEALWCALALAYFLELPSAEKSCQSIYLLPGQRRCMCATLHLKVTCMSRTHYRYHSQRWTPKVWVVDCLTGRGHLLEWHGRDRFPQSALTVGSPVVWVPCLLGFGR